MRSPACRPPALVVLCLLASAWLSPRPAAQSPEGPIAWLDARYPGYARQYTAVGRNDEGAAAVRLGAYLDSLPRDEADLGMELVVNPGHYASYKEGDDWSNLCLELLLSLVEGGAVLPGDGITLALAIANNLIYARADDETRSAIRTDVLEHFAFYRDILSWQKASGFPWSLDRAPLLPKIMWAMRFRYIEWGYAMKELGGTGKSSLSLAVYREYIDRVSTLRSIASELRNAGIADMSFSRTLTALERRVLAGHRYRHSVSIEDIKFFGYSDEAEAIAEVGRGECYISVRGTTREWQDLTWLNYQWNERHLQGLPTIGDCGTMTCLQMAFYRAAGIAPLSMQRTYDDKRVKIWPSTHNFPAAYNPMNERWQIEQAIDPTHEGFQASAPLELYVQTPILHYLGFSGDFHGFNNRHEATTNLRFANFSRLGFSLAEWRAWSFAAQGKAGTMLTEAIAPSSLRDADDDGLFDPLERIAGTSPSEWDTDRDGSSDAWELDRGFDPRSPAASGGTIAVDGFVKAGRSGAEALVVRDAESDFQRRNTLDIKEIEASCADGMLYLGATYWRVPRTTDRLWHSFQIRAYGEEARSYWVQGNAVDGLTYFVRNDAGRESIALAIPPSAQIAMRRDGELLFPLSALGPCRTLQITYYTSGEKPEGGVDVVADGTAAISIDVSKWTGYHGAATDGFLEDLAATPGARSIADSLGDQLGTAPAGFRHQANPDIESLSAVVADGIVRVGALIRGLPADNDRVFHTLHIQAFGERKVNYWLQGCREWGVTGYTSFRDGESGKSFDPQDLVVELAVASGAEWLVPLALFRSCSLLKLRCLVNGIDEAGNDQFGVDGTSWLTFDVASLTGFSGAAADGKLEELQSRAGAASVQDPRGDGSARSYPDIRALTVAVDNDSLWVGASFHTAPAERDDTWLTLEIRDPADNYWWVQGTGSYGVSYLGKGKGNGSAAVIEGVAIGELVLCYGEGAEWRIPRSLFIGARSLKLRLYVNGTDTQGKDVFGADSTDWLEVTGLGGR